ncbi:MAG: PPOX class F420-dependent oxidoreductase [Actinomycetota bacterium]
MELDDARKFLQDNHRAILATYRRDGGIQMSPVLAVVDGDGRVVISSREPAYKVRNLRRDPRASLCLLNDGFFGAWAFVEGPAEIVSLPEAMEGLVDYYRRAAGEHPDWDEYRAAMEKDRRVLIRIEIEKAGPTRAG